jgi:Fe-S cluster assembly scaffold protein SufB
LQTYFRINNENTGQFERTLIVVDERECALCWGLYGPDL